jgi:hypothetical protein
MSASMRKVMIVMLTQELTKDTDEDNHEDEPRTPTPKKHKSS